jgi:hypothetical protein
VDTATLDLEVFDMAEKTARERSRLLRPRRGPIPALISASDRFLGEALNLQVKWQATSNVDVNAALVR